MKGIKRFVKIRVCMHVVSLAIKIYTNFAFNNRNKRISKEINLRN